MLKRTSRVSQRGDTLIEVLFAVAIMSLAIVTSLSIMNQGTAASLRSLQITLVRQEIDSQAEALRFLNASYVATYATGYAPIATDTSAAAEYYRIIQNIKAIGATSVTAFGSTGAACSKAPAESFILNARTARALGYNTTQFIDATNFAQVAYRSDGSLDTTQGLWIEGIRSAPSGGTSYTDFHIRACWGAPGIDVSMNLGTIVRLYDPTN